MAPESQARERLALRGALLRLTPPLETVAEDVLCAISRVDLVARDPDGAVAIVLLEMFSDVAWYEFQRGDETVTFPIQLSHLQKELLRLLGMDATTYA